MKRLHEVIEVPRSCAEAFRYTANFGLIEQWDPGVTESEKLTPGALAVGSRFRVVVKAGLGTSEMHYTITRFEPPHRVVLEGKGGAIHAVDDIRFVEAGGTTRIDYMADITLGGAAGRAEFLLGPVLERAGKKAMAGLKKALTLESAPPAESCTRDLLDRMVLPGALGFTRFGYEHRSKAWRPITESLEGRTAIVTGATSGLGRVVAEQLSNLGARVVLVGRNQEKLEQAVRQIAEATGNCNLAMERADLSLMSEVRSLAQRLLREEQAIQILINNAAVLPLQKSQTAEGLETAFATDLVAPYLLTRLLIPRLRESAPARIINVSSGGMYLSGVDLDELQNPQGRYDGARAGQTWPDDPHRAVGRGTARLGRGGKCDASGLGGHAGRAGFAARFPQADPPGAAHSRAGGRHHRLAGRGDRGRQRQRQALAGSGTAFGRHPAGHRG